MMTVQELIDKLSQLPDTDKSKPVRAAYSIWDGYNFAVDIQVEDDGVWIT